MIGRLTGFIVECEPTRLLLEVGGVGYSMDIPLSTFYVLNGRSEPAVSLFVHTHVREDALQLFGFATKKERSAFEMLVGIAGVGPRLALSILSGIGVDELREAVTFKDRMRLQKIPGVGKKTAERLLLELGDRIDSLAGSDQVAFDPESVSAGAAEESRRQDVLSALMNLGYSRSAASDAIEEALAHMAPDADGIEPLLKEALSRLVR
jgi:Holliday junction DNA helicase RuvA